VRILPIGDDAKVLEYSTSILNELRAQQVRAQIDKSNDNINGKIQRAGQMKVHTMFVIGKRDPAAAGPMPSASAFMAKETGAQNRVARSLPRFCSRSKSGALDYLRFL